MSDTEEPDDDTLAAFTKILTKVGPEWLKEQLKTASPPTSEPKPSGSLEAYLQETVRDMRETVKGMTSQIERMRDVLTPEQLIQLRSPATLLSGGDGANGPPSSTQPPAPAAAKPGPSLPTKPKRNW